jgi:hypothetical protein
VHQPYASLHFKIAPGIGQENQEIGTNENQQKGHSHHGQLFTEMVPDTMRSSSSSSMRQIVRSDLEPWAIKYMGCSIMMHGVEAVVTEAEIRDRAGEGALPSGEYDYHQFLESYPSSFLPLLLAPNLVFHLGLSLVQFIS